MNDYESYDALGLAEQVARGEVKPEELLDEAIRRVEVIDPKINAVVTRSYDDARAAIAEGLPEGPFRGVPFLIKDLHTQVKGVRLTQGSRLFSDFVSDHDSELTTRYRRAGLVIFGRTHSPEFGLTTTTESLVFGQTRNPWSPEHTAGGSSGGAAAAVAAGILPLANASDGGGSIRIPASCCGLFGMKPTRGRTPMGPDAGEGWSGMSIVHAVSRSVRDNAALLDATGGPDLGAPYHAPAPERPYLEEVSREPGALRIAWQSETFNGAVTHPDCLAAVEDAAALCESLGHRVECTRFQVDVDPLREATLTIISANLASVAADRVASLGRELSQEDLEIGAFLLAKSSESRDSGAYARSIRVIHAVGRELARFQLDHDVVLTPTMAAPPSRLGVLSLSNAAAPEYLETLNQSVGFTQLMNVTGCPAMSVPLSWNGDGLPIGIQYAGRFGDEGTLYRLAGQLERARPWFERRPA
jgi:amidase/6-aminohexanoate-cyclic-dimer hydrolase